MFKNSALPSLVLLAAFAGPSSPSLAQSAPMIGTWTGTALQNIGKSGYTVVMTITAAAAVTDYPELKCSGALTRVGAANGYVFYTEKIVRGGRDTGGSCIDGSVTIAPAADKLAWGWVGSFQGKTYVAWSTLTRK